MSFEPTSLPATIDALHLVLGVVILILLFLALRRGSRASAPPPTATAPAAADAAPGASNKGASSLREASPDAALQLLSLLQQEGRLLDFVHEDLTGFSDADVGAAARVVHSGGQKVLKEYFSVAPVREEAEESRVTLPPGFDPAQVRLTGKVVGKAPFTGTLVHRGWRVTDTRLPKLASGHDPHIVAPAEVEL